MGCVMEGRFMSSVRDGDVARLPWSSFMLPILVAMAGSALWSPARLTLDGLGATTAVTFTWILFDGLGAKMLVSFSSCGG